MEACAHDIAAAFIAIAMAGGRREGSSIQRPSFPLSLFLCCNWLTALLGAPFALPPPPPPPPPPLPAVCHTMQPSMRKRKKGEWCIICAHLYPPSRSDPALAVIALRPPSPIPPAINDTAYMHGTCMTRKQRKKKTVSSNTIPRTVYVPTKGHMRGISNWLSNVRGQKNWSNECLI